SRWEGFGLVLAEYMKLGKAIVATEVDAIPDLITDQVNGLLVEMDNVEQAAKAIKELFYNEKLKQKIISNSLMRVNAFFNIERVATEHTSLFIKMLNMKNFE
ncbi:glycosyltransferase, partial [uncultured Bacteroides sp.]